MRILSEIHAVYSEKVMKRDKTKPVVPEWSKG